MTHPIQEFMLRINSECRCGRETLLINCGLDSLDLATVISMAEARYGLKIYERGIDWSTLQTVGDFMDVFQ